MPGLWPNHERRADIVADRVETRHGRVGGVEMVLDLDDGVGTGSRRDVVKRRSRATRRRTEDEIGSGENSLCPFGARSPAVAPEPPAHGCGHFGRGRPTG
jgi:hypothetical protein